MKDPTGKLGTLREQEEICLLLEVLYVQGQLFLTA